MKKRTITGATVCIAFLTSASAATSLDSIHYESPWELVGAALIRPRAVEKIVVDTGNHCATLRPTIAPLAAVAVEGWQSRNGPYILRSAHYRKDLQKAIEARPDSEQARGLQRLVGPEVDAIVQSLAERTVSGFKRDLEDNLTAGEELCRGYLEGAKDGKLDLKIRDPEVAQFLDKISVEPSSPTEQR